MDSVERAATDQREASVKRGQILTRRFEQDF